jgi:very-short-patch-repair endonuclease
MRNERGFIGPNHSWPAKRERARQLRRESTPAEKKAWALLRPYRELGAAFRRQQVIDGFIVDFFCASLRLVIELDGGVHDDPAVRSQDEARDAHLTGLGLIVVRLRNGEVSAQRLEQVVRSARTARGSPLPRQGEGDRG